MIMTVGALVLRFGDSWDDGAASALFPVLRHANSVHGDGRVYGQPSAPPHAVAAAPGNGTASAGRVGSAKGWSVVGLGDSVTSGYACDCTAFVEQYATLTHQTTGRSIQAQNLGAPGLTIPRLLEALDSGGDDVDAVSGGDVILLTVGANDVAPMMSQWLQGQCDQACLDNSAPAVGDGVSSVLDRVKKLRGGQPTQILVTTYWNVVLDGQVALDTYGRAYQQASDELTRKVNQAICAAAEAASAVCVDLYAPFKGDGDKDPTPLLAADGDHPNASGHTAIAQALLAAGWPSLT